MGIAAAAAADPDARPMTPEEFRTARRVPRVKTLRRARGLTQPEFAARYQIPLGSSVTGNKAAPSRTSRLVPTLGS